MPPTFADRQCVSTLKSRSPDGQQSNQRPNTSANDNSERLRPSELSRIQRLISLASTRCDVISDKQRFTLGLIGARVRKSGSTTCVSDDERHLLNEIEARLFDLDDGDLPELDL